MSDCQLFKYSAKLSSLVVTSNRNRRLQGVNTVLPDGRLQAGRQIKSCGITLCSAGRGRDGKQSATAEGSTGVPPLQPGAVQALGRTSKIQATTHSTVQCVLHRQVSKRTTPFRHKGGFKDKVTNNLMPKTLHLFWFRSLRDTHV